METPQKNDNEAYRITGDWELQSKQLKQRFAQLTDADLTYEPGKEDALLTRIETRLNKKREELIRILQNLAPAKT